jgi:site-specific DNA-methyltransferase (adenine-specific)
MNAVHYSSATDEWATPADFYATLDAEFHFTLDPCSTDGNAKCAKHYTKEQDGLSQDWGAERVFCNPPYGRTMPLWIAKCSEHGARGGGDCGNADPRADRYKGIS